MADIVLDTAYDIGVETQTGDFSAGDTMLQEVDLVVGLNQGELKSDPLLGPSLIRLVNSAVSQNEVQQLLRLHLARDRKDYDKVKQYLKANFR